MQTGALLLWLCCLLTLGVADAAPTGQNPPLRLESVRVEPAGGQEETLVRRNLPLGVGQTIDSETLILARRYLKDTGLFESVDIYTTRGSVVGAVVLVVEATLDRHVRFETGLGHEPLDGWYLNTVGMRMSSPFGRGGEFRTGFRAGQRTSGFFSALTVPSWRGSGFDVLLEFEATHESWQFHDKQLGYGYSIERMQLRSGLQRGTPGSLVTTVWAGVSASDPDEEIEGEDDDDTRPATDFFAEPQKSHYVDLAFEALWDRRDRLRPWQAGSWAAVRLKTSIWDNGSSFWGIETDLRVARPVAGTRAIALRFHAAANDLDMPFHLREIFGGARSLRGFARGGLSGPQGAQALYFVNAEWRQPLVGDDACRPRVLGTIFLDAGDHWNISGARHGLSADLGCGVQFTLPWVQVVNFEVAYPLTDEETGHPVMVHCNLGRSF